MDQIDSILSTVDLPAATPAPVLTPDARRIVHETTTRAYHAARAEGLDHAAAQRRATDATEHVTRLALERSAAAKADDARPDHYDLRPATMDAAGRDRSLADLDAMIAGGFSPAATVYERGLRVLDLGVENATASRADYESKPLVRDACRLLVTDIGEEHRADLHVLARDVAMNEETGLIELAPDGASIEPTAFAALVTRLGYGGAAYLATKCDRRLRAHNVNEQRDLLVLREDAAGVAWDAAPEDARPKNRPGAGRLVLRTRHVVSPDASRSIYAVVSPSYAAFDADKVAEAIALATPPEARGSVAYDGHRSRFEILFQSTVQPRHFVAGEFFRAGVIVTTDDTGGGSVRGRSVAWQNLCLNLIVIDECVQEVFALMHVGTVEELARKFRKGFALALGKLDHFIRQWDYATELDVRSGAARVSETRSGDLPASPAELAAGIFRGLLVGGSKARIKLPRAKNVEDAVAALVRCWERDESSARAVHAVSLASVANAITRYAHEVVATVEDPFAEDDAITAAASLLWPVRGGKAPKALEYVEVDAVVESAAGAS